MRPVREGKARCMESGFHKDNGKPGKMRQKGKANSTVKFTIVCNILQSKYKREAGTTKKGAGIGSYTFRMETCWSYSVAKSINSLPKFGLEKRKEIKILTVSGFVFC